MYLPLTFYLVTAHTVSEAMAQNRVFMYEPSLINNLADLIHPEKNAPLVSIHTH